MRSDVCASADPSRWKCVSQHGQNRPRGEAGKQGRAWVALRCRGSTLPGSQFRVESCCGREAFGSVLPLVESVEMKSFAAPGREWVSGGCLSLGRLRTLLSRENYRFVSDLVSNQLLLLPHLSNDACRRPGCTRVALCRLWCHLCRAPRAGWAVLTALQESRVEWVPGGPRNARGLRFG